jgi:hypothetical protein
MLVGSVLGHRLAFTHRIKRQCVIGVIGAGIIATADAFVIQPCTYVIMIYALAHAIAIVVLHIIVALMVRT